MDHVLLQDIGKRIQQRRKALGYTQEQMAEMMNVSVQMVSNLERGNKAIRIDNLINISRILKVSTDYILTGMNHSQTNSATEQLSQRDQNLIKQITTFCLENPQK